MYWESELSMPSTIRPILLATWSFGVRAIDAAWPTLIDAAGGALDAVEVAGRYAESDLSNHTVGTGGWPDRDGNVSLDAAVMLSPAVRGAVCDIRNYAHPISIARRVAEKTPHTLIAGRGAEAFAAEQGFSTSDLLTEPARQRYDQWLAERDTPPNAAGRLIPNFEEHPVAHAGDRNDVHDTIGVLALDPNGTLAAGCTTSGLPWKLPGRVGDSPIIGHGLYCDPHVGAAVLTGHGELVSGICGAFLAVELLRHGASPFDAARGVIERLHASFDLSERSQVGIIVLAADGSFSSASLRPGFKVAVHSREQCELTNPDLVLLD